MAGSLWLLVLTNLSLSKKDTKRRTGVEGEARACSMLAKSGYTIRERNFRHRMSEIDIIAEKENCLIFVEVKTRSSSAFGHPEEFVSRNQQKKILEAADFYIEKQDWQGDIRFDIISIIQGQDPVHLKDAFY